MSKNRLRLNIVISISSIMLILVGIIFSASVFGWFSSNRTVTASGMSVTVDTPKNIFVSNKDLSQEENNYIALSSISSTNYAFDTTCGFTFNEKLYPASYNGNNFYYARKVTSGGNAKDEANRDKFIQITSDLTDYYYIERTFYILTTYPTKDTVSSINVYLSNITISQGSTNSSNLYKAARVAISARDNTEGEEEGELGTVSEKVYRYNTIDGSCLPANGVGSVMASDIAIDSGDQDSESNDAFIMNLKCVENSSCYFYPITIKIWIEGQNANATSNYAGTGFFISFQFKVVE